MSTNADVSPKCLRCDQDFKDNESLVLHVFQNHWRKCSYCLSTFDNLEEIPKHLEVEHDYICHVCLICNLVFKSVRDKGSHMKNCQEAYKCFYCFKNLSLPRYVYHIREGHKGGLKPHKEKIEGQRFICKICNKEVQTERSLQRHIMSHEGKKDYTCDICGKSMTAKYSLTKHIKYVHWKIKEFECEECHRKFSNPGDLRNHKIRLHEGGKPRDNMCDICGKGFTSKSGMLEHVRHVHEKLKKHKCDLCGKTFSTNHGLKNHKMSIHDEIRKFPCDLCDKTYINDQKLREHKQNVHEGVRNHKCPECHKEFFKKINFDYHVKIVHRGIRDHKCDECGKEFVRKKHLDKHLEETGHSSNTDQ